jgi:multidrug efflux system membrane fusion protein
MAIEAMNRRAVVAVAAAALAAILLVLWLRSGERGHAAPPPAQPGAIEVPVTPVIAKTVPIYLDYIGATDAIRIVTLQAQVTGFLQKRLVPDGAEVKEGDLLYQIDPRNYQAVLDQAKAQAQKDAAALDYAQATHRRNAVLSKTGDVSVDVLQQSASAEQQASAAVAADRAAIETAELNLAFTEIRAPFAGRLSYSVVHEGALITTAGTQLNTLVQLDPIYATFAPPDTDLPEIQKHQAGAPIATEVVISDGATYRGKLTFLDNAIGRSTGTITARATIENPNHTLLPGQFVRVRLHITDQPNTLLVPQLAVSSSQLGKYVYTVGPGNKVDQRFVTLGAQYGPLVAVSKGVAKGEPVVVGNLLRIGPGAVVKPVPTAVAEENEMGEGSTR